MAITEPKILAGFMELLPQDQAVFNQMYDKIRSVYESFGFLPLDTPVIEYSSVLLAKAGGETEKQIYRFTKGDNDLSLRFDLTVPLARYTALHKNDLVFPFKRYQMGKVYRGERPQKGRFREFYQCDIDIIGNDVLENIYDAEMPAVIYTVFRELGLGDFTIKASNRKLLNGLFDYLGLTEKAPDIMRAIDKLPKIGEEKVRREISEYGIGGEAIDFIIKFISVKGSNAEVLAALKNLGVENEMFKAGLSEAEEMVNNLPLFGVPEKNFTLDLTIARGLDYYTGAVYETFLNDHPELGSVCSGGRYENLAGFYTKDRLPGIGLSIGLTRLYSKLKEAGVLEGMEKSISKILFIPMGEEGLKLALESANLVRSAGIPADVTLSSKGMKQKMKYADRLGVPYVAIIGSDEAESRMITVKNLKTGEQTKMPPEEIPNCITK